MNRFRFIRLRFRVDDLVQIPDRQLTLGATLIVLGCVRTTRPTHTNRFCVRIGPDGSRYGCDNDLKQTYSAAIGIVGGIVDMVAGVVLLQPSGMMASSTARWGGYFLLTLGIIVLLTGLFLLTSRMMKNRSTIGMLMLLYGVIMLVLGVVMLGQVFSMMQGSTLSGSIMLLLGALMLYSGYGMTSHR